MRAIRVVLAIAAAGFVGWTMLRSAQSGDDGPVPAWRGRFPNVPLRTHDGRTVRFYDDLIRGKIVTINFMYVECEGTCPGTTSTLVEVRNRLGDRVGQDIAMLSITLQPEADTPERLRDYAARYGAGPGMTFLTGKQTDIDVLRRALGLSDERNPGQDADRRQHLGILRIGNEPRDWWTACPSLSGVDQICALLKSIDAPAAGPKPPLENPDGPPPAVSLGVADLGEFEALRAALDELHMTRATLEWKAYVDLVLTRMGQFLKIGTDRDGAWRAAMRKALADSAGARRRLEALRRGHGNIREAWGRYREEQSLAMAALDGVLDDSPRHRAFRDDGPRWLFYLEGHPEHPEKPR
jgi:protein SCO1/2